MNKLTIEQKAKAYEEAIERARKHRNNDGLTLEQYDTIDIIFPELKESEDEKMRKGIIRNLEYLMDRAEGFVKDELKERIAWLEKQGQTFTKKDVDDAYLKGVCDAKQELEKQGEQKPANKVEPKFHEGDWVVSPNGVYWHIDKISNNRYEVTSNTGKSSDWNLDTNIYHKFNIQDAEDGDVLVNWNNTVFIFKAIEDETVKFHIAYNEKWNAIKTPSTKLSHLGLPEPQFEFHPTTKEQRDTLFKAMADAGYTFNFEKKELNKIGSKPVEWSEKDETMATNIIIMLKEGASLHFNKKDIAKGVDWLKSIRPQSHWKPSDEQMITLRHVISGCSYDIDPLVELETKLKEL